MRDALLAVLGGLLALFFIGAARIDRELRDPERRRDFHRRVAELPRPIGALIPVLLPVLQLFKVMEPSPPRTAVRRPARPVPASTVPAWVPWLLFSSVCTVILLMLLGPILSRSLPAVLLPVCMPFLFPWAFVRRVLIPLRLWFPSWLWAFHTGHIWCDGRGQRHRREAAVVAGTLALLRGRRRNDRALRWLERRLAGARELRGSTVLAHAVLAAARGQSGSARDLFEFCVDLPRSVCPRIAQATAREWLCADAAARGEWSAVIDLAAAGPRTRATRLLRLVARRFTDGPAGAPTWRLWLAWVQSPRRRHTFSLVHRAQAWTPATAEAPPAPPPTDADALAVAGRLHARLLTQPDRARPADIVRCARSWQAALDRGAVLDLARTGRAATSDTPAAAAKVAATVEADLIAASRAARIPLTALDVPGCALLGAVADELRASEVRAVDEAATALANRVADRQPLPVVEELAEFVRLRRRYISLVRTAGQDSASIAFASVHRALCNLAHWLHNERNARLPAHFMFASMLPHAKAARNEAAAALLAKNADCGF